MSILSFHIGFEVQTLTESNLFFQDNETKAGKMAKNLRCDENVLEEFANGVLRFPQQKLDLPM